MSKTYFVDTNIFLHYLTQDEQRYKACLALFLRAERNQVSLITSEAVIVETVFVLSSPQHYRLARQQIYVTLSRLLLLPGLKLLNRNIHLRALALYAQHALDFEDCLSIAYMEQLNVPQIYSYARSFDHINAMQRVEPELAPVERGEVLQLEVLPSKPPNHDE